MPEKVKFKSNQVKAGYAKLNPALRQLTEEAPLPLLLTSTFRDPRENAGVGGVPSSYHTSGNALDIRSRDRSAEELAALSDYYKKNGYQVLNEKDHLHVEPSSMPKKTERSDLAKALLDAENISDKDVYNATKAMEATPKQHKFGLEEGLGMAGGALSAIASLFGDKPRDEGITPISSGSQGAAPILGGQGYNAGPLQSRYGMGVEPYRTDSIFSLLGRG